LCSCSCRPEWDGAGKNGSGGDWEKETGPIVRRFHSKTANPLANFNHSANRQDDDWQGEKAQKSRDNHFQHFGLLHLVGFRVCMRQPDKHEIIMTAPTVSSVVTIAIPARVNILSKGPRHDDAPANAKRVPKLFDRVLHFCSLFDGEFWKLAIELFFRHLLYDFHALDVGEVPDNLYFLIL